MDRGADGGVKVEDPLGLDEDYLLELLTDDPGFAQGGTAQQTAKLPQAQQFARRPEMNSLERKVSMSFEETSFPFEDYSLNQPSENGELMRTQFKVVDPYANRRLTFEQVFELLISAEMGRFEVGIPIRPQASPVSHDHKLFFVSAKWASKLTEQERHESLGSPASLTGVKYQSFGNGKVWWSERFGNLKGLVARNMSCKVRPGKNGSASEVGYGGRWYSLLERSSEDEKITRESCRLLVKQDAPSLVQFWNVTKGPERKKRRAASITPSPGGSPRDLYSSTSLSSPDTEAQSHYSGGGGSQNLLETVVSKDGNDDYVEIRGGLRVTGDVSIQGDLSVTNIHVQGSLSVEGAINGQLVTPPEAADYAEWFDKLNPDEPIKHGDVVQLQSPSQKVTLKTSGNGPFLVVSTKPSVAAGVPFGRKVDDGVLCGFIGQIPVRVRGPIKVGDLLVPSGLSDGAAIAGSTWHSKHLEPLGSAMESCGEGEHVVLAFVRWQHSAKWSQFRTRQKDASSKLQSIWRFTGLSAAESVITGIFLWSDRLDVDPFRMQQYRYMLTAETILMFWALLHFPQYWEFLREMVVFNVVGLWRVGFSIYAICAVMGIGMGTDELTRPLSRSELASILTELSYLVSVVVLSTIQIKISLEVYGALCDAAKEMSCFQDFEPTYSYLCTKPLPLETSFSQRLSSFKRLFGGGQKPQEKSKVK